MDPSIRILENEPACNRAAAAEFVRTAQESVRATGRFTVALSGGSTPRGLYSMLAGDRSFRDSIPWKDSYFFWGDERHVPPDDSESNYRMALEVMLSRVPVPSANIYRIHGERSDAGEAAEEYEAELRQFFRLADGQLPRFDLILLGMGSDGHTAGLLPGTSALSERSKLVVHSLVESTRAERITMTVPLLNNAAFILFLITGQQKAAALREVLQSNGRKELLPAQRIRPVSGKLLWFVDRAAASMLQRPQQSRDI